MEDGDSRWRACRRRGGGEALTPAGTDMIFKSLGKKTTIKQPELRLAGKFSETGRGGNGFVRENHLFGAK